MATFLQKFLYNQVVRFCNKRGLLLLALVIISVTYYVTAFTLM